MGEEEFGFPGFTKSVRSFLEALSTLEHEAEILFERIGGASTGGLASFLSKVAAAFGASAGGPLDVSALLRRVGAADFGALTKGLVALLGVADESKLEAVRDEVREVVEQVARLRERELALAGGVSQLRARAARFEEALAGLARVQGKCVARLDGQVDRAHDLERLAARRDDHITRLIRDTAGQRAELERLRDDLAASRRPENEPSVLDTQREVADVRAKLGQIESHYSDLKKLQAGSSQRVVESLESLRDRIARLESRAAEMSREARAKAGRLDALARHVATVEGRLTTAIGKNGEPIVPVTKEVDRPMPAVG
jgi:predicted  nucleic acid-binding Zn-ribbon protein